VEPDTTQNSTILKHVWGGKSNYRDLNFWFFLLQNGKSNSEASIGGRIQRHTKKDARCKTDYSIQREWPQIHTWNHTWGEGVRTWNHSGGASGRHCWQAMLFFRVMGRGRRHCCRQHIYEMRLGLLYPCVVGSGRWPRGPIVGNAARSELTRVPILDVRGVGLDVRATKGCRWRVLIDGIDWTVWEQWRPVGGHAAAHGLGTGAEAMM
jgi:hypothetical protein